MMKWNYIASAVPLDTRNSIDQDIYPWGPLLNKIYSGLRELPLSISNLVKLHLQRSTLHITFLSPQNTVLIVKLCSCVADDHYLFPKASISLERIVITSC